MSPSRVALERLFRHINGHVIAFDTSDTRDRPDDGAGTREVQAANKLQCLLDSMQPPIVVCAGISAYNLVQGLSLPWQPTVIAAQHTITWSADYERTLAGQINRVLSARAT
ncbi:MAG: hypothetical protein ABI606_06050 [Rhodoferax sp.]